MMLDNAIDVRVLAALRRRRSTARVKSERPPREVVEQILEAGAQAPNHHKTRPWRFIVLAGEAREALGEVMARSAAEGAGEISEPDLDSLRTKQRGKPLRAPVIVVVAVEPSDGPKVVEIEEVAAGAAAVENMLLAAEALGLGAMWRTGPAAYDPAVKRFLDLPETAHIVAFVYLGYPDLPDLPERERGAASLTRWMGWDTGEQEYQAAGNDLARIRGSARSNQTDYPCR
jgi:nitroreductase